METWMVFLLPETGMHLKMLTELAAGAGLRTKETCFGVLVEGEPATVKNFFGRLKQRYPLYAKRRGFSIEDTEVCARTFRQVPVEGLPAWLFRYAGQIRRYTS